MRTDNVSELTTNRNASPDAIESDRRSVIRAIQAASADRTVGTYRGETIGEEIVAIVWEEHHRDEAVCVVEFLARRITYLDGAQMFHPELDGHLAKLTGWDSYQARGPIPAATRAELRRIAQ